MKTRAGLVVGFLLATAVAGAQNADVTFFVIGKHANVRQDSAGRHEPIDFSFFSEVFLTQGGDARNATLTLPTGQRESYEDQREADGGARDNILLVSGAERFTSFADLQSRYPDGQYGVSFDTPSGAVEQAALIFSAGGLPAPPTIRLVQSGKDTCPRVSAAQDLTVTWSAFAQGGADPNGILDDLVFVILTDESGTRVAHSGRPFEGRSYLTYADKQFTIDANVLQPDRDYTLSVEHAILDDTRRYDDVPAMTTRAITTKLMINTRNRDAVPGSCTGTPQWPSISSQTVMFYYKELDAAAAFYGGILGFENELDLSWVKLYKSGPASTVGLVKEGEGAYHKVQPRSAVMLSLVTEEVDAWYARLKSNENVVFLKDIGSGGGIRSFLLEDPGGYTVEFYQWLEDDGGN